MPKPKRLKSPPKHQLCVLVERDVFNRANAARIGKGLTWRKIVEDALRAVAEPEEKRQLGAIFCRGCGRDYDLVKHMPGSECPNCGVTL